jgi:tRNA-2-methylthio-N6-dimethylallyladenosine synthase
MAEKKLKYYLFILGCQMNVADAEKIAYLLDRAGYLQTDKESEADLIITVACSVRQSAIDRIYGRTRIWSAQKKNKKLTLALTGCLLTIDRKKMSEIFDIIFDINGLAGLPNLLKKHFGKNTSTVGSYFSAVSRYPNRFQAYVPISTGCNNFCTYCVVPYTRGREISRPAKEIIQECKNLIEQGYKEITLLGQNVNSYGHDLKNSLTFPQLLQKINGLPGNFWIKFATSHPKDMSDELIQAIAKYPKICEYVHLPVQSGDNEILQKMNRHYTRESYIKLINKIRKQIESVSISTDVIVGFPGETKRQFQNSADLFKQAKYDMAYLAQYSPRPQTVAYKLKDSVYKSEKKKREESLNSLLKKTALANNKKLIGRTLEVLARNYKPLSAKKNSGYWYGLTRTQKNIRFPKIADDDLTGKFVKIKVARVQAFSLEGKLIK